MVTATAKGYTSTRSHEIACQAFLTALIAADYSSPEAVEIAIAACRAGALCPN